MVELRFAESFLLDVEELRAFAEEADAPRSVEVFLDALRDRILPNLRQFPDFGRDLLARAPASRQGEAKRAALRRRLADGATLREYIVDDHIVLYLHDGDVVTLLAVRHHRQLGWDVGLSWIGP